MTIRVVVADDQAPFRRAVRMLLARTDGFELVGEAMSGEEAVSLAVSLEPDLVLMDIRMRGIGGIEAARTIHHRSPCTATVLVSTYRAADLPAAIHGCGAVGYLHKSDVDAASLRRLYAAALSRRRGRG